MSYIEDTVGQCPECDALIIHGLNGECSTCGVIYNRCDMCEELFSATSRNTCDDCIRAEYAAGSTKDINDW